MEQSQLSKKLHVKEGNRVLLLNSIEGFEELLSPLPENVTVFTDANQDIDVVHVFVVNQAEVKKFAHIAINAVKEDGKLWFAYQKKSAKSGTDITRDTGWDILKDAGYRGVSLIAIDATWSSMRFRKQK